MSKRRHKARSKQESTSNDNINNRQPINNNPFGINPNQLLSMFGNIDMNQINNMLQSMTTDGFDFNNFNLGSIQNLMNGGGRNQNTGQQSVQQSQNRTQQSNNDRQSKVNIQGEDENIQMLLSLRKIVNEERGAFIDKILKLYDEGAFEE